MGHEPQSCVRPIQTPSAPWTSCSYTRESLQPVSLVSTYEDKVRPDVMTARTAWRITVSRRERETKLAAWRGVKRLADPNTTFLKWACNWDILERTEQVFISFHPQDVEICFEIGLNQHEYLRVSDRSSEQVSHPASFSYRSRAAHARLWLGRMFLIGYLSHQLFKNIWLSTVKSRQVLYCKSLQPLGSGVNCQGSPDGKIKNKNTF